MRCRATSRDTTTPRAHTPLNLPATGGSEYLTFQRVVSGRYQLPPGFPPAAADLVSRLLVLKREERLGGEKGAVGGKCPPGAHAAPHKRLKLGEFDEGGGGAEHVVFAAAAGRLDGGSLRALPSVRNASEKRRRGDDAWAGLKKKPKPKPSHGAEPEQRSRSYE